MYALMFKKGNCVIIKDIDIVIVEHNNITVSSIVNGDEHTEYRSTNYSSYQILNVNGNKLLCVTI